MITSCAILMKNENAVINDKCYHLQPLLILTTTTSLRLHLVFVVNVVANDVSFVSKVIIVMVVVVIVDIALVTVTTLKKIR